MAGGDGFQVIALDESDDGDMFDDDWDDDIVIAEPALKRQKIDDDFRCVSAQDITEGELQTAKKKIRDLEEKVKELEADNYCLKVQSEEEKKALAAAKNKELEELKTTIEFAQFNSAIQDPQSVVLAIEDTPPISCEIVPNYEVNDVSMESAPLDDETKFVSLGISEITPHCEDVASSMLTELAEKLTKSRTLIKFTDDDETFAHLAMEFVLHHSSGKHLNMVHDVKCTCWVTYSVALLRLLCYLQCEAIDESFADSATHLSKYAMKVFARVLDEVESVRDDIVKSSTGTEMLLKTVIREHQFLTDNPSIEFHKVVRSLTELSSIRVDRTSQNPQPNNF